MGQLRLSHATCVALLIVAAACSPSAEAPGAQYDDAPATPPPARLLASPTSLPEVDAASLRTRIATDATLEIADFAHTGSTTLSGAVEGYEAQVWAVPVAAGQTLSVQFQPAGANLYLNIVDSGDASGAALHRGEVDGPSATITAARDTVYLLQPYQPRAMARRNARGEYLITVTRS